MIRTASIAVALLALGACSRAQETEPAPAAPSAAQPAAPASATQQPASPRDTARGRVGGTEVFVDYGRPYMRGRVIMGGLVPYGEVWRTGANEATHLVTGADLRMGETTVPAGTYTLYTVPAEGGWQLIVNRQTGQWGTQYDAGQDLARIPMATARMDEPVEQFTIRVDPRGEREGALVLEWENTRAEVPFAVLP